MNRYIDIILTAALTLLFIAALIGCAYYEHFKFKVEEQAAWCAGRGEVLSIYANGERKCRP